MDEKKIEQIGEHELLTILCHVKELELQKEEDISDNVYLDAFVALGGKEDKEGSVSKETLIQILKNEFEMTIDLEAMLRKLGGENDEVEYYQFCILLETGSGGNASRVSNYLSQNKGQSCVRFSYFVHNMDKC